MVEEKMIPELRFVEFDDEWEEKSLEEILSRRKKVQKISKEAPLLAFASGQGVIPRSERKTNNRDFLTKDSANKNYLLTEYDDIVYNPSNLKYGAIDRNSYGKGVISPIYVTFVSNISPLFMEHIVKSYNFQQKALRYEEGTVTKRQSVHPNDIIKIKIKIPKTENERIKIGSFLSLIDKKIGLLEEKYQKNAILKNYYYSTMFNINTLDTLKIEYEELFLEDIVTKFSTGLNPRKNFKLNDGGDNFYVTIKNFENGILNLDDKCDKIDDIALNLINKRSDLKKDDLLFASIGRVGEVYLIKEDPVNWNINESVFSLRANKKRVNPKFLYCLMKEDKIQHYFDTHITGSTFKSIKMKDLRKTPITLPCDISKQEYIADFLLKFDKKCYLVEKQIKCFNQFKKGLLQKMFI